jgi:hypothetical protein
MDNMIEEREKVVIRSKLLADKVRQELRNERRHCSNLQFIIHAQKGYMKKLKLIIKRIEQEKKEAEEAGKY